MQDHENIILTTPTLHVQVGNPEMVMEAAYEYALLNKTGIAVVPRNYSNVAFRTNLPRKIQEGNRVFENVSIISDYMGRAVQSRVISVITDSHDNWTSIFRAAIWSRIETLVMYFNGDLRELMQELSGEWSIKDIVIYTSEARYKQWTG